MRRDAIQAPFPIPRPCALAIAVALATCAASPWAFAQKSGRAPASRPSASATPASPQAAFKVAFLMGFGAEGPRFLDLRPAEFNPAGLFTTSDAKVYRVALSLNRSAHQLDGKADPAAEEEAIVKLAGALERVAAVRVLVALPSERHAIARLWHKDRSGWRRVDAPGPKEMMPAALQRWLERVYGYPAWVRGVDGPRVTLRISPSVTEAGTGRRQALLLRGEAGKPLGPPQDAEPLALLSCVPRGRDALCDRVLEPEGDREVSPLSPGLPVWFP